MRKTMRKLMRVGVHAAFLTVKGAHYLVKTVAKKEPISHRVKHTKPTRKSRKK